MNKKTLLWCFIFFLPYHFIYCQSQISGIVIDEKKEPLAFVNILINENYNNGVATDINGKFNINTDEKIKTLTLTYVGYEKLVYSITEKTNFQNLQLQLQTSSNELREAIVIAGENPAHRIIKKVVANRDLHNPEKISAFQCQTYNKVIFELVPDKKGIEIFQTKHQNKKSKLRKKQSDNFQEMLGNTKSHHLMVMESVSERKYLFPEKNSEKVIYNRVSGFKDPSFVALANDVQPFSFYGDYFDLIDKSFLNPISPNSTKKYFFNIEDTLYQGIDSVFIISFHPKKGKNFTGLEGMLYINTNGYALQNVIAQPAEQGFMQMKIEQSYIFLEGKQWFPNQLNFVFQATKYPHKYMGSRVTGKSYISEVKLNPTLSNDDFVDKSYTTAKDANTRTDSIWQKYRQVDLSQKEERTYEKMDSLGAKKKFDLYLDLMDALATGRFPIGKIDLDLQKMLAFNNFENARVGLGLVTNEKLSERFELGGYYAYGFADKKVKYGGHLLLDLLPLEKLKLRLDYQNDIRQPALTPFPNVDFFSQRLYAQQMDRWEDMTASLLGRMGQASQFNFNVSKNKRQPLYDYQFNDSNINNNTFSFFEIGLNFRFVFAEKIIRFLGNEFSESRYPKVFLSYKKGFKNVLDGQFDFHQVLFAIEDDFRIRNFGETTIRLEAGRIDGDLPYSRLFTSSGIGKGFQWIEIENTFQTMELNEFLSDRFVHLFFMHNFGTLLFKVKKIAPEISVVNNIGFGKLKNPSLHEGFDFKTLENGLFETGLRIDNLIKLNYVNFMYLGLGGGIYYRYGKNAFPLLEDNLAYRLRIKFSF